METGVSDISSDSITNKRENLICALCLDIFCDPKLLPCAHTYCQKCLDDLLQRTPDQSNFLCPSCRKEVHVPSGGAAAFQANFYIDAEDLERARDRTRCFLHPQKKFDLFCVECDSLICMDCKLTEHLHHASKTLADAAQLASDQLTDDKARLEKAIADLEENSIFRETDQTEFKRKKEVVEQEICQRHATIIAAAGDYRDKALAELEASFVEKAASRSEDLGFINKNVEELRKLSGKIDMVKQQKQECEIVLVAKEMRSGEGSPKAVDKLTSVPQLTQVSRPVHRFVMPSDAAMFDSMKEFIGKADHVAFDCTETEHEVMVMKQFRCEEEDDIGTVFGVCPMQDNTMHVSFDPSYKENAPKAKEYSKKGNMLSVLTNATGVNALGRVSMYEENGSVFFNNGHDKSKCSKKKPSNKIYTSYPSGLYNTFEIAIVSGGTADAVVISCGSHRTFDVDSSETRYAVVTESKKVDAMREVCLFVCFLLNAQPTTKSHIRAVMREVRLYKRPQKYDYKRRNPPRLEAMDTYCSPVTPFQPADVCFFSLRGQEMLLIADERNDAIHVVDVQNDKLTFSRFLCPGNPHLLQPTALNTDHKGRLWVANRGARIVVFRPLPDIDGDDSLEEESSDSEPEELSGAEEEET